MRSTAPRMPISMDAGRNAEGNSGAGMAESFSSPVTVHPGIVNTRRCPCMSGRIIRSLCISGTSGYHFTGGQIPPAGKFPGSVAPSDDKLPSEYLCFYDHRRYRQKTCTDQKDENYTILRTGLSSTPLKNRKDTNPAPHVFRFYDVNFE